MIIAYMHAKKLGTFQARRLRLQRLQSKTTENNPTGGLETKRVPLALGGPGCVGADIRHATPWRAVRLPVRAPVSGCPIGGGCLSHSPGWLSEGRRVGRLVVGCWLLAHAVVRTNGAVVTYSRFAWHSVLAEYRSFGAKGANRRPNRRPASSRHTPNPGPSRIFAPSPTNITALGSMSLIRKTCHI